jgi:hypothetical protein
MVWVRERTTPTERPRPVGEVIAKFADRGCHVVSLTDPYGRIPSFTVQYQLQYITWRHMGSLQIEDQENNVSVLFTETVWST